MMDYAYVVVEYD